MLIEFTYGIQDYSSYFSSVSSLRVHETTKRELFENWGTRFINKNGLEMQLINVPDSLLFAFITAGLPEKCVLYYDQPNDDFYLVDCMLTYKNYITRNLFGNLSGGSYGKDSGNGMFDWGSDKKEQKPFFLKIPKDFNEDLCEVTKPYIKYSFNKNIINLLASFKNNNAKIHNAYVSSGGRSMLIEKQNTEEQKPKFEINCTTEFWNYLIYDMFEGTMYKEFSENNQDLLEPFIECLVKLQNIYNETGNINYDPSIKP